MTETIAVLDEELLARVVLNEMICYARRLRGTDSANADGH
jgi:hypothetical protein